MPASLRPLRAAALLLAPAVLAAACASDAGDQVVASSTTTQAPAAVDAGDPSAPGAQPGPGGDDGATPAPAPGTGGPTDPDRPSSDAPAPDAPADAPAAPGPVGSMAARYLRPTPSERVLVQVLAQDGAAPQPAVPERVRQVLAQLSGKGVELASAPLDGGPRSWSADELRALADAASPAQTGDRAVLTLLFLRGGFAENERAVGVAVRGDVAAVFAERVDEAAGVLGDRDAVEDAVTMHEVGHLLGLVDLVLDTGRADPEHPGHSPNRGSVMYYAVESTLLGTVLSGGPPRDFDQADLDDLARIRNG